MSNADFVKKLSSKELSWLFNKQEAASMMMEYNGHTFIDEGQKIEVRNLRPEAVGHMVKVNWWGKK